MRFRRLGGPIDELRSNGRRGRHDKGDTMGQPGVRFEIQGGDLSTLRNFYSELFGWEIDTSYVPHYGTVGRNTNAEGLESPAQ